MEDKDILIKLKSSKTIEEFKTIAKEIGYELTDEEAQAYFNELSKSDELSDDELTNVSGGGCTKWRRGRAYSGNPPHYLIVTVGNSCKLWEYSPVGRGVRGTCNTCYSLDYGPGAVRYCIKRRYDNDPLNPPNK